MEFKDPPFFVEVKAGKEPNQIDVDLTLYDHFGIPPEMLEGKDMISGFALLYMNRMRLRGLFRGHDDSQESDENRACTARASQMLRELESSRPWYADPLEHREVRRPGERRGSRGTSYPSSARNRKSRRIRLSL